MKEFTVENKERKMLQRWFDKAQFLISLGRSHNIGHFVETGTHMAYTTAAVAMSGYFDSVKTVEINNKFYEFSCNVMVGLDNFYGLSRKGIKMVMRAGESGHYTNLIFSEEYRNRPENTDASNELREFEIVNDRSLIWLDAHNVFKSKSKELAENHPDVLCPALVELEGIKSNHIKDHVIVIDDVKSLFSSGQKGYPTLEAIKKKVSEINPDYKFRIHEDMLVCEVSA